jgi:hypothetical protein
MDIGAVHHLSTSYTASSSKQSASTEKAPQEASRVSDLSQEQKGVKEQMTTLKADNDLFGALKTLQRSVTALGAIANEAQGGALNHDEALESIGERMAATQYKGMNLFENFPLEDGTTLDMSQRLTIDATGSLEGFQEALAAVAKEVETNLSDVKARIMGGTQAMGEQAQKSYEKSGMDRVDPASIVSNTDVDYLKSQFKRLMG